MGNSKLNSILREVRECTVCAADLPLGPQPIVQAAAGAAIVIIGQAPGKRVHESGVPWDDHSGDTLRKWIGVDSDTFHDPNLIALVPMGFCYPGSGRSGDLPPRKECAPLWHDRILCELQPNRLGLIIGTYAQQRYLDDRSSTPTCPAGSRSPIHHLVTGAGSPRIPGSKKRQYPPFNTRKSNPPHEDVTPRFKHATVEQRIYRALIDTVRWL